MVRLPDGRVLFFGLVNHQCPLSASLEVFDPESETFQMIAVALPKPTDFSATLLDTGEILIAGGDDCGWNSMTAATWLLKP